MEISMTAKQRYRVPVIREDVEVYLDEFSDEQIAEYVRNMNIDISTGASNRSSGADGLFITSDELNRINPLALCGQANAARELALSLIAEAIERPL